ncbi:MAG: 50S ribosomal protein L10 [Candidatus Aenigmarchaeota archaeon]|nr:50S ribosomal protein L10 [Candidatus Aenigmarchaeota archaeon]
MFNTKEEKVEEVKRISDLIEKYPTLGILDIAGTPSKQLQEIKRRLGEEVFITITKKSMLKLAIRNSRRENIHEVEKFIPLQPGLVFTKLDAFKFYLLVTRTKSLTFAKGGDVAGKNIEIKAGPTKLTPGPVIGELTKAGIAVGVEGGKIAVKKNVVVVKAGEKISQEVASALKKLGIATREIGLNVVALYTNGKIYGKDVLNLIGDPALNLLKEAFGKALNLSIAINYPTKENIGYLLAKAHNQAKFIESRIGD